MIFFISAQFHVYVVKVSAKYSDSIFLVPKIAYLASDPSTRIFVQDLDSPNMFRHTNFLNHANLSSYEIRLSNTSK